MKKIKEILIFLLPMLLVAGAGYAITVLRPDVVQKAAPFTFVATFMVLMVIFTAILENVIPERWKKIQPRQGRGKMKGISEKLVTYFKKMCSYLFEGGEG